jgi:hypothetical protein
MTNLSGYKLRTDLSQLPFFLKNKQLEFEQVIIFSLQEFIIISILSGIDHVTVKESL